MRKVCGNIFEDRNIQLKRSLQIWQRFSQIFQLYDDIYIGICRIFEKYRNVSIQSEFLLLSIYNLFRCFRKFVFTEFLTTWVCLEMVMCDSRLDRQYILIVLLTFFACT